MNARYWLGAFAIVLAVSACAGSETYGPLPASATTRPDRFAMAARDMCASTHGRGAMWELDAQGRVHCYRERPAP